MIRKQKIVYKVIVKSLNKDWMFYRDSLRSACLDAKRNIKKMLPDKKYIQNNPSIIDEFYANIYVKDCDKDKLIYYMNVNTKGKIYNKRMI